MVISLATSVEALIDPAEEQEPKFWSLKNARHFDNIQ
jgi:hypothetical protein